MRELLQIGEVARLVGVSTRTIRYYHKIDLLSEPERTTSGYRLYTARHLLQLRRIRRLRVLGLPLERIRQILAESPEKNESTLRSALYALVEEATAQILALEERRTFLQDLLAREQLEFPDEDAHLLYSPEIKTQLAPLFANLSAESLEWGQRIDAMLGSFNWPSGYRQGLQHALQHVAEHTEQYSQLFVLEERFAALATLPPEAPQVEQLVEAYIQSQELLVFAQHVAQTGIGEKSPFASLLPGLMADTVSLAQQRFLELLASKASDLFTASPVHPKQQEI